MKLKNLFRTLGIALLIPTVSACSFVRTEDNSALGIKELTWEPDKDGNIIVTITYTDEEKPTDVFTVPKPARLSAQQCSLLCQTLSHSCCRRLSAIRPLGRSDRRP